MPRLRMSFVYLYVYIPLIFEHILHLQYDFDCITIRTTSNLYLPDVVLECAFSFFAPWRETPPHEKKPHEARILHIAEESIWHAIMSDTEGTASNGTPTNGVADAGESSAGSGSVAEGSTSGAGGRGSGAASPASGATSPGSLYHANRGFRLLQKRAAKMP